MCADRFRSPRVWGCVLFALVASGLLPAKAAATSGFGADAACRQDPKLANKGRIEFRMENRPWREVFAWLSEQTGVPVVVTCMPVGSFTFVGPQGARYTIPEVVGIINRALLRQKNAFLLRRPRCFALYWADEPVLARGAAQIRTNTRRRYIQNSTSQYTNSTAAPASRGS
jgi:hypothetical protein